MRPRSAWLAAAAAFVVTLSACGGEEGASTSAGISTTTIPAPRQEELPGRLRDRAFDDQADLARYCLRHRAAAQGEGKFPGPGEERRAFAAADALVRLAQSRPLDLIQTGVDVRLFVTDIAEDLEGLNCEEKLITTLEAAG